MNCALCGTRTTLFSVTHQKKYHICSTCKSISLHPSYFLSNTNERKRYEAHNNDIHDIGYQQFVSPIVNAVVRDFLPKDSGLDFGSGSGPVITAMLRKKHYTIQTYDPFFDPNEAALTTTYDYIACCEVMEHFYDPHKEFSLLFSLLKPNGRLYCKTKLFSPTVEFDSWWYKNDPSHVFFYSETSLIWIKEHFGFSDVTVTKDLITFIK